MPSTSHIPLHNLPLGARDRSGKKDKKLASTHEVSKKRDVQKHTVTAEMNDVKGKARMEINQDIEDGLEKDDGEHEKQLSRKEKLKVSGKKKQSHWAFI